MTIWVRFFAAASSTKWLALLAPVLILGIIGMHSMLVGGPDSHGAEAGATSHAIVSTSALSHDDQVTQVPTAGASTDITPAGDGDDHDPQGAMGDCSGLVAMCLALLASIAGLLIAKARGTGRVLWQLPPAPLTRIGGARRALESLSPLQRTTILRC